MYVPVPAREAPCTQPARDGFEKPPKALVILGFTLLFSQSLLSAERDRIDIQRVLPDGQLSREIPAEVPVTLRISGTWPDSCVPTLAGFERNGPGRLLNLLHNRADLLRCIPGATRFSHEIAHVRFEEDEIGVLSIAVVNTHFSRIDTGALSQGLTWLPTVNIAIQPLSTKQITVWPTARQPPVGWYALTALYDVSGGWYSPEHAGSGLTLHHDRRAAEVSRQGYCGVEGSNQGWFRCPAGADAAVQDELWGIWNNFDTDGRPQWHLFSESYWATPTRLLGKVYRTEAEAVGCTAQFPNTPCQFGARPARRVDPVGIFQLDIQGPDELILTIDDSATTLLPGFVQPPVEGYRVNLGRL